MCLAFLRVKPQPSRRHHCWLLRPDGGLILSLLITPGRRSCLACPGWLLFGPSARRSFFLSDRLLALRGSGPLSKRDTKGQAPSQSRVVGGELPGFSRPGLVIRRLRSQSAAMPEDELHHPHDSLFKRGFAHPADTAAFLSRHLPAHIAGAIQWDLLSAQSGQVLSKGNLVFNLGKRRKS